MATGAEIQAALADALENDLSFDDMAVLLKRALVNAYVSGATTISLPLLSTSSRGTSITFALDRAEAFLAMCLRMSGGGVVSQFVEFPGR